MPDAPNKGAGDGTPEDPILNLKAEMNRKLGNIEEASKKANAELLSQIQSMLKPKEQPAPLPADDLEEVFYKDPKAYAARVKEATKKEILEQLQSERKQETVRNTTLASLTRDFPELNDPDSDLYKAAVEKYSLMAETYGESPAVYEAAVAKAALEKGMVPKSKRRQADDSDDAFTVGGRSGDRPAPKKKGEVAPEVEEFAKFFPEYIKLDDPEVRKRLATNHGRRSYKSWE